MSVKLMFGNCLEEMKKIPDGSVDMVMADLPYGTTACKWDSVIPLEPLWREYRRLCSGAVVLTAAQPFTSALVLSNTLDFRYSWIWEKSSGTGFLSAKIFWCSTPLHLSTTPKNGKGSKITVAKRE